MTTPSRSTTTRILIALTSHDRLGDTGRATGAYLPEVAHPWRIFRAAHLDVDLVAVRPGRVPLDGVDESDPDQRDLLADPRMAAALADATTADAVDPSAYRALLFAGGHGTMWDFPGDPGLAKLAAAVWANDGVLAAVCHGPAGLADLRLDDGTHLVAGRNVTGFSNDEERAVGLESVVPFLLEDRLREHGGRYSAGGRFEPHVVVDGRLVTGQNPASSRPLATEIVRLLTS